MPLVTGMACIVVACRTSSSALGRRRKGQGQGDGRQAEGGGCACSSQEGQGKEGVSVEGSVLSVVDSAERCTQVPCMLPKRCLRDAAGTGRVQISDTQSC